MTAPGNEDMWRAAGAGRAIPSSVAGHLLAQPGRVSGHVSDVAAARAQARRLRAALPSWATLLFAVRSNGYAPVLRALLDIGVTVLLEQSTVARKGLGDAVVDAVVASARSEWAAYCSMVSEWERARGFERR